MSKKKISIYAVYGGLCLYSFLIMLFCTKSSPIYVLNDWYDANAYFTMGKGLMNGMIPYKDLFDHKGPFLYFIHGIGYLINNNGFFGIFILQVISMSVTLIFAFKIADIYNLSKKVSFIVATLIPVSILSQGFYMIGFEFGGGSPDEFVIPIFSMILYLFIKLLKKQDILKSAPRCLFFIGLLSSLIFQLKFTHLSLVFGLLVSFFIYLLVKKFGLFIKSFFLCSLGFFVGLIPYMLYATITNSVKDFLHVYIRFNKIYGASNTGKNILVLLASAIKNAMGVIRGNNIFVFIVILLGLLWFLYAHKEDFILNISIILSCIAFLISASVVALGYNFVIIGVFSTFGYIAFYDVFKILTNQISMNRANNKSYSMSILVFTVCCVFVFTIFNNQCVEIGSNKITHLKPPKSCQSQVADIVLSDSDKDYSLLEVLSLDSGFYTSLGVAPKSKYFYIPNISFDKYPYVFLGQYEDVCNKLNKYVISKFEAKYKEDVDKQDISSLNYVDKIGCAIAKNYELVDIVDGTYLQAGAKYYLYKQIN